MTKRIVKATIDELGWPIIEGQKFLMMGEHLYLDGEDVGRFHFMQNKAYTLVLNSPEDYKKFAEAMTRKEVQLSVYHETIVEVPFKDFERQYLQKLEAVHRDAESYFVRDIEYPIGKRFPEKLLHEIEGRKPE